MPEYAMIGGGARAPLIISHRSSSTPSAHRNYRTTIHQGSIVYLAIFYTVIIPYRGYAIVPRVVNGTVTDGIMSLLELHSCSFIAHRTILIHVLYFKTIYIHILIINPYNIPFHISLFILTIHYDSLTRICSENSATGCITANSHHDKPLEICSTPHI